MYISYNDDLDEKSKVKRLGLTSVQGKVLVSLHNLISEIVSSIGNDPSVPIPNLKTWDKWWSRSDTVGISVILLDNLKRQSRRLTWVLVCISSILQLVLLLSNV